MTDSPRALLDAARTLVTTSDTRMRFVWARAATHLGRQALEAGLDQYWLARGQPAISAAPMRAQLVCLPFYLDGELAHRVAWTWAALSQAGHHHGYEFAPAGSDLTAWLDVVGDMLDTVTAPVRSTSAH